MYNYHSNLKATHPYSSQWHSWIVDYKPMCYYRADGKWAISSITAFGNPCNISGQEFSRGHSYTRRVTLSHKT